VPGAEERERDLKRRKVEEDPDRRRVVSFFGHSFQRFRRIGVERLAIHLIIPPVELICVRRV
jgi:hypothetical protein